MPSLIEGSTNTSMARISSGTSARAPANQVESRGRDLLQRRKLAAQRTVAGDYEAHPARQSGCRSRIARNASSSPRWFLIGSRRPTVPGRPVERPHRRPRPGKVGRRRPVGAEPLRCPRRCRAGECGGWHADALLQPAGNVARHRDVVPRSARSSDAAGDCPGRHPADRSVTSRARRGREGERRPQRPRAACRACRGCGCARRADAGVATCATCVVGRQVLAGPLVDRDHRHVGRCSRRRNSAADAV